MQGGQSKATVPVGDRGTTGRRQLGRTTTDLSWVLNVVGYGVTDLDKGLLELINEVRLSGYGHALRVFVTTLDSMHRRRKSVV